jgi:hypothetical protein
MDGGQPAHKLACDQPALGPAVNFIWQRAAAGISRGFKINTI